MEPAGSFPRRTLLRVGAATAMAAMAAPRILRAQAAGPVELPPLPYRDDALAPVISADTIGVHYGRHHAGYVANLNRLLAGPAKDLAALPLEEMVKATRADPKRASVFNNAAQVWNHNFYWHSLKPGGGGQPPAGRLGDEIGRAFGDYARFRAAFAGAATGQFGSGWAWLVWDEKAKRLAIAATGNADTPLGKGTRPLLTIDVWEHAYYLDYQNRRADYVAAVIDKLLNWDFALAKLG